MKQNLKWIIPVGCVALIGLAVCVALIAVGVLGYLTPATTGGSAPAISLFAVTPTVGKAQAPTAKRGDMQALIKQHDGQPCKDVEELTCVTLSFPLDHAAPDNGKKVDVTFGIHPATGERFGMFFQAFPGGPGGAGIASSSSRLEKFDKKILEHYDIVFFDQRGVGLSSPLSCAKALTSYRTDHVNDVDSDGVEGPDTPKEQQNAIDQSKTFVDACVKEIGLSPDDLKLYSTPQVIEDIESFRQAVGDEKFYLYGVSYGTEVGQMYAAAHADHLAGLILDGTLDLTLEGVKQDERQMKGFQTALDATLKECAAEPACKTDFGGDDPAKVYDDMAASLSKKPQAFEFPLADGTKAQRLMTLSKLESAATYAMYSRATRMILMRSLAAAHRGDFVPLARLFYGLLNYSPASEKWTGDPTFSDTDFYAVGCTDNNYFTGTADERAKAIIQESKGSYGTDARLDEGLYSELICIDWPTSPDKQVSQPPLKAPGVPTLVLNATLDPATPFQGGKDVASRLEDGYHIYVEGGEHGSYANDEKCPDDAVTNLLVYGEKPAQRETKCSWSQPVMWSYLTPAPADAKTAGDNMLLFMFSTDIDILLIPEHAFSKPDQGKTEVACPYGGKFNFDLDKKTKTEAFTFAACEFSKGFAMTGTGSFNVKTGDRTYEIDISGTAKGNLTYKFIRDPQSLSITGTYGGKTINIQR